MYLTHAEIDVTKSKDVESAIELARRYKATAIVVPPDLVHNAVMIRGLRQAKNVSIICAIDWHKGDHYGTEKFIGVSTEALQADGFEILLTARTNYSDTLLELKYLSEFVRGNINPQAEFRLVLGMGIKERSAICIENMLKAMRQIPHPHSIRDSTIIRNDNNPKKLGESLFTLHNFIKDRFNVDIKASVNAQPIHFQEHPKMTFGVTLEHAKKLASGVVVPEVKEPIS